MVGQPARLGHCGWRDGGELRQSWGEDRSAVPLLESAELQLSYSGHENELFVVLEGEL